jgi:hypothetical protein
MTSVFIFFFYMLGLHPFLVIYVTGYPSFLMRLKVTVIVINSFLIPFDFYILNFDIYFVK